MVNFTAWLYTYVIRGTPMLVQLFLIYYGLAQFEAVRDSVFWPLLSSATFCACLAFGINTSAYTAEIIAGSLKATPWRDRGGQGHGHVTHEDVRRILLPSALRRALPQYSNEVIMMLQTTSLASIVTLIDITGAARTVNAQYYLPFEAYITAGVFYLCLTFILVRLFKMAERRWLGYLAHASTDRFVRIDSMYKLEVQDRTSATAAMKYSRASLAAKAGDVISIIGSSGSGKSTFLRCINLLEQPHAGKILLNNEELRLVAGGRRAEGRRPASVAAHALAAVDGVSAFQPVVAHDRAGEHHRGAGACWA